MTLIFRKWTYPAAVSLGLLGYPLVTGISGILDVDNRVLSFVVRAIVVCLCFVVFLRGVLKFQRFEICLLFLFWTLYSGRIAYEMLWNSPVMDFMSDVEFLFFAYGTCFIPLVAAVSQTKQYELDLSNVISFLYPLVFIITILNTVEVLNAGTENYRLYGRLFSQSLNPIAYGSLGSVLALMSFFMALNGKKSSGRQMAIICGLLLGLTAIIISGSKGPMLSTVVGVVYYYLCGSSWKNIWKRSFFIAISAGFTTLILSVVSSLLGADPLRRILSGLEGDASTLGRLEMWSNSWSQFLESPIVGSGLVELGTGYWPHNLYIESFMATGLIGGMIFSLLCILGLVGSIAIVKYRPDRAWISLLYVQQLVVSATTNALWTGTQFWVLIGLSLVVGKYAAMEGHRRQHLVRATRGRNDERRYLRRTV